MDRRTRKTKHGSRASDILLELLNATDLLFENIHQPGLAFRYGLENAIEIRNNRERWLQNREVKRLEKRKLVEINKIADKYHVCLTDEGKIEALRLAILEANLLPEGQDCIVMFDIPESKRKLRKQIRELLKEAGFFCIQRSVWMSPFDAAEAFSAYFRSVNGHDRVRVYTGVRC